MTRSLVRGRIQGKGSVARQRLPALYHGEDRRVVSPGAPGADESSTTRGVVVMGGAAPANAILAEWLNYTNLERQEARAFYAWGRGNMF